MLETYIHNLYKTKLKFKGWEIRGNLVAKASTIHHTTMNQLIRICLLSAVLFNTACNAQTYNDNPEYPALPKPLDLPKIVEAVIAALTNETLAIMHELTPEYVNMVAKWKLSLQDSGMMSQGQQPSDFESMIDQPRPYEPMQQNQQQLSQFERRPDRMGFNPGSVQEPEDGQPPYGQPEPQQEQEQPQFGQTHPGSEQLPYGQSVHEQQRPHYGQSHKGPQQPPYGQSHPGSQQQPQYDISQQRPHQAQYGQPPQGHQRPPYGQPPQGHQRPPYGQPLQGQQPPYGQPLQGQQPPYGQPPQGQQRPPYGQSHPGSQHQSQYGISQQRPQHAQYGQPHQGLPPPQNGQFQQNQQQPQFNQPQQGQRPFQNGQPGQTQQIQFQQKNPGLKMHRRPRPFARRSRRRSDYNEDDYVEGWTH